MILLLEYKPTDYCSDLDRYTITKHCEGCTRVKSVITSGLNYRICTTLREPNKQWTRLNGCAHRTHNLAIDKVVTKPGFIDPLKASKQSMKKKH